MPPIEEIDAEALAEAVTEAVLDGRAAMVRCELCGSAVPGPLLVVVFGSHATRETLGGYEVCAPCAKRAILAIEKMRHPTQDAGAPRG